MSAKKAKYNTVQVIYQRREPYLYGSICKIKHEGQQFKYTSPFVISKNDPSGREITYGTVAIVLEKVNRQVQKLQDFSTQAADQLKRAGIISTHSKGATLPKSEVTDKVISEQERLIEDVLLVVSANIRILAEIFPDHRLNDREIPKYDYESNKIGFITLVEIAKLLLHNRYILAQSPYVVDLYSDHRSMAGKHKTGQLDVGFKFNFEEYMNEVLELIRDITVQDLADQLQNTIAQLSTESNIKDIMFAIQNLHAFGRTIIDKDGPLRHIMNKVALRQAQLSKTKKQKFQLVFTQPNVGLDPDLRNKQISIQMLVNGQQENHKMGYEDFFKEVAKAFGDKPLLSSLLK